MSRAISCLWMWLLLGVGCAHSPEDYTELPTTNNPYIIQDPTPFGSMFMGGGGS